MSKRLVSSLLLLHCSLELSENEWKIKLITFSVENCSIYKTSPLSLFNEKLILFQILRRCDQTLQFSVIYLLLPGPVYDVHYSI